MNKTHAIVAKEAFEAVMLTMKLNDDAKGNAWLNQDVDTHLAHARQHLHLLNRGDTKEDHIRHAVTRIAMALAIVNCDKVVLAGKPKAKVWVLDDVDVDL